ncbi:MAG: TIGR00266 family protein [Nitrospirae bacterium RIFCSPLOWO2_01_FULL_62_17]|nr:MAG: TIGR00266 family protein [Nitrospirae bacterium RIFCSPLOWO2_01_FULL_62_17]
MKSEILYPGAFPMVRVQLDSGESFKAESGAMVSMSPTLDVESKMEGGLLKALSRKVLTGEHFFFQTLRATRGAGEALLAPTVPGEIVILELDGVNEYLVQKDGFLAGSQSLAIESKMQSFTRGLLGGEGFFILKIGGKGTLILNSFGAIHLMELKPDEEYIVDNSHLVAWTATTTYKIEKAAAGWISSFTSGEGFICRFRGPGVVYIQTRNPQSFGAWVRQFMPTSSE